MQVDLPEGLQRRELQLVSGGGAIEEIEEAHGLQVGLGGWRIGHLVLSCCRVGQQPRLELEKTRDDKRQIEGKAKRRQTPVKSGRSDD